MKLMMDILRELTPLNRVMCSTDYDRTLAYLQDILPFNLIEFPASAEHNGWVIPPKWDVKRALILKDGNLLYDGTHHALGVIALSASFNGKVDLEQLRNHLHFDHRYDDAIPFHFRQQYRTWEREWGFCVTKKFYDALEPGEYTVVIETEESDGVLKVLEYTHQGDLDEAIVFGANLDHPGVSNDGLSGCVVGIELLRRLLGKRTKFSYKLVLVQGIIGSEYYLGKMTPDQRAKLLEGVFLEMLGSRTQLALQNTRDGLGNIEHAIASVLSKKQVSHRVGPFQSIIINDEYIWENHGIPMASLSRFPYPEYHCDKDNISNIGAERLDEAVDILEAAVDTLESSNLVLKKFSGNVCLSNPKYNLYVDPGQVAFGDIQHEQQRKLRVLMDLIPALDRTATARSLAERSGVPEPLVVDYLSKWAKAGLVELR